MTEPQRRGVAVNREELACVGVNDGRAMRNPRQTIDEKAALSCDRC